MGFYGLVDAVLVNAHTDSTLPSPGAADDLFGVAAMLEALRVMAHSPRELTNAVVFLFNGGEESLQVSRLHITSSVALCCVASSPVCFRALTPAPAWFRPLVRTPLTSSRLNSPRKLRVLCVR